MLLFLVLVGCCLLLLMVNPLTPAIYTLSLHDALPITRTTRELGARGRIQVGGEHRERFQRAVLREIELQRSGNLLHRLNLRVATNTGDGDTNVNSRTLVQIGRASCRERQ